MADTAKRLAGPLALTGAAATLYTAPAATTTIVRHVHVANVTAAAATFRLSIGADGATTRLWHDVSVPPGDAFDWNGFLVLAAGETVQGYGGTADALVVVVSGIETS